MHKISPLTLSPQQRPGIAPIYEGQMRIPGNKHLTVYRVGEPLDRFPGVLISFPGTGKCFKPRSNFVQMFTHGHYSKDEAIHIWGYTDSDRPTESNERRLLDLLAREETKNRRALFLEALTSMVRENLRITLFAENMAIWHVIKIAQERGGLFDGFIQRIIFLNPVCRYRDDYLNSLPPGPSREELPKVAEEIHQGLPFLGKFLGDRGIEVLWATSAIDTLLDVSASRRSYESLGSSPLRRYMTLPEIGHYDRVRTQTFGITAPVNPFSSLKDYRRAKLYVFVETILGNLCRIAFENPAAVHLALRA